MGICYQGLGDYDSAIVYYDKFIASEKNPNNIYPRMYTYRGKIEADRKNYPKALEFYNKTISLDKNIAEALKGKTIAIQNLVENTFMFVGVAAYMEATRTGVMVNDSIAVVGILFLLIVAGMTWNSKSKN